MGLVQELLFTTVCACACSAMIIYIDTWCACAMRLDHLSPSHRISLITWLQMSSHMRCLLRLAVHAHQEALRASRVCNGCSLRCCMWLCCTHCACLLGGEWWRVRMVQRWSLHARCLVPAAVLAVLGCAWGLHEHFGVCSGLFLWKVSRGRMGLGRVWR